MRTQYNYRENCLSAGSATSQFGMYFILLLAICLRTQAVEPEPVTAGKAPPIPQPGSLAAPRSMQQTGLLVELVQSVVPADNAQTPDKITLGKKLFFDGRLSVDGTVACATYHDPAVLLLTIDRSQSA